MKIATNVYEKLEPTFDKIRRMTIHAYEKNPKECDIFVWEGNLLNINELSDNARNGKIILTKHNVLFEGSPFLFYKSENDLRDVVDYLTTKTPEEIANLKNDTARWILGLSTYNHFTHIKTRFIIISTGWNCRDNIHKHICATYAQTYTNWVLVLISDGSKDGMEKDLKKFETKQVKVNAYKDNMGAAYRRYHAIHKFAKDNDVVVLVGMDDVLLPNALEKINEQYSAGKLTTYGNWIDNRGYVLPKGFLDYSDKIHDYRHYRIDTFRATGLNTFKKKLFNRMNEEDFMYNGEWIKATTESNLMFSMLEMCGREKTGIIYEPIVVYNVRRDNTVQRMGRDYQDMIYQDVIKRKPKERI